MFLRWAACVIKSVFAGVGALVLVVIILVVSAELYGKYVAHLGPNETLGWDPSALFGKHWKAALLSIPVLILLTGFLTGLWFFSRSLRQTLP
jgi:hypothetical protein